MQMSDDFKKGLATGLAINGVTYIEGLARMSFIAWVKVVALETKPYIVPQIPHTIPYETTTVEDINLLDGYYAAYDTFGNNIERMSVSSEQYTCEPCDSSPSCQTIKINSIEVIKK